MNIPLEETSDICAKILFKNTEKVESLSKTEFKEILSVPTKEYYFTFNGKLYKQVDGSPLGPTLGCAFLYFEKDWLQNCPSDFKPHY